jgi:ABC-type glutathione transport system ATPase component
MPLRVINSGRPDPEWTHSTMMELQDVTKIYQQGRRAVHALRGVSLMIEAGEFV